MEKKITPALKQYLELKEKYKDAILMFRMGDFYEMFFEDAEVVARELEIALTSRPFGKGMEKVPMCGVPCHSAQPYIARLVKKGYRVAICEQLEPAKPGKVVERDVVRVITPGTFFEDETEDRTIMAIFPSKKSFGTAWSTLSTGELYFSKFGEEELRSIIAKTRPKEVVVPDGFSEYSMIKEVSPESIIQERSKESFSQRVHLAEAEKAEIHAVSGLISFIEETQKAFLPKLSKFKKYTGKDFLFLDHQTLRNLEILEPINKNLNGACLLNVLDRTKTGMGKRTLKKWLLNPLKNKKKIEERLDAVQELINDRELSQSLDKILSKIYDIERLTTKITSGLANPKDLHALKTSIKPLHHLKELLLKASSNLLKELGNSLDTLSDIGEKLERTIEDNPPATFKEGGVIKRGVCEELDQLKDIKENAEKYLKELEERERKRTGIQSLKVGYNSVFGYYIEVSKPNLKFVPEDYIRKQTLVNAERFITKELKEFEEKLLTAQERIEALELEIFRKIRNEISENSQRLFQTSEKIGIIDALNSLSKVAKERDYVRPVITEDFSIFIKEGKHPVLEKILQEDFIPNDTYIDENHFIILLTGPNMGGKSVFLRQTALIVLMAHIGSFVPAKEAKISIVDKIFSRVGSADDISRGLSTFMMEMVETSNILRNATSKSLIILDEIGRGTSTKDGLSIARAVIEYIATKIKAKTLFATHYHELTELEGTLKGLKNYHVSVEEVDGKVVFTHKVLPGASEKSYGIHVAELAGLPEEVIERAKEILSEIEKTKVVSGLPLFEKEEEEEDISEVVKILESVEISETTPLEALMLLARLKKALKKVRS